jgi:hypothetical protein
MSIHALNKICHRVFHDEAFRAFVKRDPAAAIAGLPLTDDERRLLLAGDVARLFEMGVHPFLLGNLSRWDLFGLTEQVYSERIRTAHDPR